MQVATWQVEAQADLIKDRRTDNIWMLSNNPNVFLCKYTVQKAPHLCVVPVAVERAVPLLTLQNAVVGGRSASQPTADPQRLLQIPGKHLPLLGPSLVIVHVVVLGAPVLVEQQGLHCHILYHLQMQLPQQLPAFAVYVVCGVWSATEGAQLCTGTHSKQCGQPFFARSA